MTKILLVCMGNICRSPTAALVLQEQADRQGLGHHVQVDSAGTSHHHRGEPMDPRAQAAAREAGYRGAERHRARGLQPDDLERFDWVLAMDRDNLAAIQRLCPPEHAHKVQLFLAWAGLDSDEVPDPYYGNAEGFRRVLTLCEHGANGLLQRLFPLAPTL